MDQVTSLIGSVIIAMILKAAYSRADLPIEKRKQYSLFSDEVQRFATEDYSTLLSEARKFSIATTIAHQARYQPGMTEGIRATSLNAANLVIFKVSGVDAEDLAGEFDSTPPPPEIINFRPILTPKNDVIVHLRAQGHSHPAVCAFTNNYLVPAMRVIEANRRSFTPVRVSPLLGQPKRKVLISELNEAINQLNALLYSVSVDRNPDKHIPPIVFYQFSKLFGFSNGFARYFSWYNYITNEQGASLFRPKAPLMQICSPDYANHKVEIALSISPFILTPALAFVTSLRMTMQVLASDPILVNTGQHEEIYDKPRTYQDVQNECATRLANLPKYHAKVKIADSEPHEYIIKTIEPEKGLRGTALQDRIEHIRVQNRKDGYTRPRQEVDNEITKRQSQWNGQQQSPRQQPRSRGSLVCQKCGAQNSPGSHFCNQCGVKL